MADWLERAHERPVAQLAQVAAQTIVRVPPEEHPLTLSMVELALNLAMHALR
jgi:hypothetical protein